MAMGMCEGEERMGLGLGSSSSSCSSNTSAYHSSVSSSAATPIGSSNIGFQLLKKHGWKEGTGLGVCEQGMAMGMCEGEERMGLGLGSSSSSCSSNTSAYHSSVSSSAATPIGSSNIGFQLLKKHGWKEGTGLGVCEQVGCFYSLYL
ncbi:unnamed protein product [Ilex paraguariensis]|uniref:G-patch domain-containing protein n=1 Tax=Ilex paraguariensis TaxID=185542 RepID=A0ABC8SLQ3_9AQUA